VHGGGFPGTTAHLLINCVLFVFLGSLVERTLGSGRFFLLTGTCLVVHTVVHTVLKELIVQGRAQGASGMTWSYGLFVSLMLIHVLSRDGRRSLRDPSVWFVSLLLLFCCIGLLKHWHLWNLLVSVPFFFWWRPALRLNLAHIDQGGEPDRWPPNANLVGVTASALLCVFTTGMTVAAVLGVLH
jgi:membrane associated rhomboid family serine protease